MSNRFFIDFFFFFRLWRGPSVRCSYSRPSWYFGWYSRWHLLQVIFITLHNYHKFITIHNYHIYKFIAIYCSLVETLNEKCLETSLLEIWKYNEKMIKGIFLNIASWSNKWIKNYWRFHFKNENSLQVLCLRVFPDLLYFFSFVRD